MTHSSRAGLRAGSRGPGARPAGNTHSCPAGRALHCVSGAVESRTAAVCLDICTCVTLWQAESHIEFPPGSPQFLIVCALRQALQLKH